MIHFLMILADFGGFSLMVTDGRTGIRTDIRMDRPSYRDARTHLKNALMLIFMRPTITVRAFKCIFHRCQLLAAFY